MPGKWGGARRARPPLDPPMVWGVGVVVSAQGVSASGVCLGAGGVHLPCGKTGACENITFPQLLLLTVKMLFSNFWYEQIILVKRSQRQSASFVAYVGSETNTYLQSAKIN